MFSVEMFRQECAYSSELGTEIKIHGKRCAYLQTKYLLSLVNAKKVRCEKAQN